MRNLDSEAKKTLWLHIELYGISSVVKVANYIIFNTQFSKSLGIVTYQNQYVIKIDLT